MRSNVHEEGNEFTSVTSGTVAMNFVLKFRQGNGTNRIWLRL